MRAASALANHTTQTNKWGKLPALAFSLNMLRAETAFSVVAKDAQGNVVASCDTDVTKYFTSEGQFARSVFLADMEALMQSVVAKLA